MKNKSWNERRAKNTRKKMAKESATKKERSLRLRKKYDDYCATHYDWEYPFFQSLKTYYPLKADWIQYTMYELRVKATNSELEVASFLIDRGIEFHAQQPFVFYDGKIRFADFVLPKYKLVIEVDGMYHYHGNAYVNDKERDAEFAYKGYKVARITNVEAESPALIEMKLSVFIHDSFIKDLMTIL